MSNVSVPAGTLSADLLYSDSERALAAALQDILSARSSAEAVRARTEQPETSDLALWKELSADIGIGGLLVPEALGGAGASYREARRPPSSSARSSRRCPTSAAPR